MREVHTYKSEDISNNAKSELYSSRRDLSTSGRRKSSKGTDEPTPQADSVEGRKVQSMLLTMLPNLSCLCFIGSKREGSIFKCITASYEFGRSFRIISRLLMLDYKLEQCLFREAHDIIMIVTLRV